jgi:excisionase family DNA binding protein
VPNPSAESSVAPPSGDPSIFVTVVEAAEMLGIHRNTCYGLIKRGEFPVEVVRIGRAIRIRRHELETFLRGEVEKVG